MVLENGTNFINKHMTDLTYIGAGEVRLGLFDFSHLIFPIRIKQIQVPSNDLHSSKKGLLSSLINKVLTEVQDQRRSKDFILLSLCKQNGKFSTTTSVLTPPILFSKDAVVDETTYAGSSDTNFSKQVLKEANAKHNSQFVIVLFERGATVKIDFSDGSKEGKGGKKGSSIKPASNSSKSSSSIVNLCDKATDKAPTSPINVDDDDDDDDNDDVNAVRSGIFNGINIKGKKLVACPPTSRKKPSNVHEGNWSSEMKINSKKLSSISETTTLMVQYAQTKGIQDFGTLTPFRVIQATESKFYELVCLSFCLCTLCTPLALSSGYDKKQYFPLGMQLVRLLSILL